MDLKLLVVPGNNQYNAVANHTQDADRFKPRCRVIVLRKPQKQALIFHVLTISLNCLGAKGYLRAWRVASE